MKACSLCKKLDKVHYRVKSENHREWIFCCKNCWRLLSKEKQYSYGGTRKLRDKNCHKRFNKKID